MLPVTRELIAYLQQPKPGPHFIVIGAMVHAILQCGSAADADALLPVFLHQPSDLDHAALLPVLGRFGNAQTAQTLLEACAHQERLKENINESVLQTLGELQYEPALPLLKYYALENATADYYQNKYAVLGLLHLDCHSFQSTIKTSIESCYGKNLFPEYVPALVSQLNDEDKAEMLEQLFELGETTASTDCNAGIILGFSLCGQMGAPYFWKVVFNPNWEVGSTATGTLYVVHQALQNLSISFRQLYLKVKAVADTESRQYALDVLLALLDVKVNAPVELKPGAETITEIYELLFSWRGENLSDLAENQPTKEEIDRMEKLLALKMKEELVLKNLNPH